MANRNKNKNVGYPLFVGQWATKITGKWSVGDKNYRKMVNMFKKGKFQNLNFPSRIRYSLLKR